MGTFDEAARPLGRTALLAPGAPDLQLLPRTRAWFELNLMTDGATAICTATPGGWRSEGRSGALVGDRRFGRGWRPRHRDQRLRQRVDVLVSDLPAQTKVRDQQRFVPWTASRTETGWAQLCGRGRRR